MTDKLIEVPDLSPSGAASAPVLTHERPAFNVAANLTVDPGTGGTTFTFTSTAIYTLHFGSGTFRAKVDNEIILATVASGTTLTVTRGQDGIAATAHAIGRPVAALVSVQYNTPISTRSVSFCGTGVSFRTLGNAAASQNLFTIENAAGSAAIVGVRRLAVEMESTAALLTLACEFKLSRPTALPTGGTTLSKFAQDTSYSSSASVVLRGATASDGGGATAITATAGVMGWHQFACRQATNVGQTVPYDFTLLPAEIADTDSIILRANEALLVQVVNPTAASNAATNHYSIRVAWDEYVVH